MPFSVNSINHCEKFAHMTIDDVSHIKAVVENVEGWITDNEGKFLYDTAKGVSGCGVIVEIGSHKGKSTIWMAKGLAGGKSKIYAIDPHTGDSDAKGRGEKIWTLDAFKRNIRLAKCNDAVVPIVKTSEAAAKQWKSDRKIEFIFIDGDHNYKFVKKDVRLWYPYVAKGGMMAFHDTINFQGPKRVVEEMARSGKLRHIRFVDTIAFGEKPSYKISFLDKLENKLVLIVKDSYELLVRFGIIKLEI